MLKQFVNPMQFSVDENNNIVEIQLNFGIGRLDVGGGINKDEDDESEVPYVSIGALIEPYQIGQDLMPVDNLEHDNTLPTIIMNFTKEESIDVMIRALQKTKELLKKVKEHEQANQTDNQETV